MSSRSRAPVVGAPPQLRLPPPRHYRLGSGLPVLLVERHDLPVVDVHFVVRAGAADDPATSAGRAFLTADLLDQGTTSRSAALIADQAELLGATLHTRGSWDFCTAALHVLSPRLHDALTLLADICTRPTFPNDDFARRQDERLAAIIQEADEPRIIASNAFARILYGDAHPFGLPLGGSQLSIASMTAPDLRTFYQQHFAPYNAFIVLVGDVHADRAIPLLDSLFGGWLGAGAIAVRATPAAQEPVRHEGTPGVAGARRAVHIVDLPGAPQSELRVGCAGPGRRTADFFPLLVANTILGGAFTSRLNMKLREEKGYTYGAGSSFALRRAGGPFLASTAVATAATADAVSDMVREVGRMAREEVTVEELARAQNYIVLGLPRMFETTADIADHLSEVSLYDLGDDYYDRYAERVRAVTAADVQSAASRWLVEEELAVVIAGDANAVAEDVAALDIGEVHVREDA